MLKQFELMILTVEFCGYDFVTTQVARGKKRGQGSAVRDRNQ